MEVRSVNLFSLLYIQNIVRYFFVTLLLQARKFGYMGGCLLFNHATSNVDEICHGDRLGI